MSEEALQEAPPPPVNPWAKVQSNIAPLDPAEEVADKIARTASGELRSIQSPWGTLSNLTHALMPGTITLLCGDPGSGKSLFLLQWAGWIVNAGETVSVLELECDRKYHLYRYLVQLSGTIGLLDPAWVVKNQDEAERANVVHGEQINKLGACISEAPNMDVTYDTALKWIDRRAANSRVVCIDPTTALSSSDKPWIADRAFIIDVRKLLAKHGASLVAVTHPGKQREKGAPSMKDLAGGAAFERFTDTILWIRNDGRQEAKIYDCFGSRSMVSFNRRLRLVKTRNGRGAGFDIAFEFEKKNLTFRELGVICEEK